jgi:phosphoribosylformylglycinamidine cyclo-ligase
MGREPVRETYTGAGVNIDAKERAVKLIAGMAKSTMRPEVMSGVGFFGGMFDFKTDKGTVLVSSIDQVGTKTKIANAMDKHDTVGIDIVNHCVNDIFTGGAEPLLFLDYIGMAKLIPEKVESIVKGLAQACREVGCALIGGETGEMAGLYAKPDDYDLVGFVIGVVAKDKIMLGKSIRAGDAAIGLPSSGLHTNGYSLVRKIFGETRDKLYVHYPELGRTLGEELLEPHRCYYNQLKPHLPLIKGLAHITGGGLIENVPRVLPEGLTAVFDGKKWTVPPIFRLIQRKGNVDEQEMYRVYNMGIGMVVICSPENTSGLLKSLPGAMIIGEIVEQGDKERAVVQ